MNSSIAAKIGAAFTGALVILLVIGGVAYQSVARLVDTSKQVEDSHRAVEGLERVLSLLKDAETGQRGYIITGEDRYLDPYYQATGTRPGSTARSPIDVELDSLKNNTAINSTEAENVKNLENLTAAKRESLRQVIDLRRRVGLVPAQLTGPMNSGKKDMDDIRRLVGAMQDRQTRLLTDRLTEAGKKAAAAELTIGIGIPGALLFLTLAGFLLSQDIARPLRQLTGVANRIAEGDLSVDVSANQRRDEVGVLTQTFAKMTRSLQEVAGVAERIAAGDLTVTVRPQSDKDLLGTAFAAMVQNLQRVIADITEAAGLLSTSASEISASTTQLASSSAETATALSETTTTIEEIRQTAQIASQKARQVSESAERVVKISQGGKQSTAETSLGMQRIKGQMESIAESMMRLSEQSQAIGAIIATVDDLAQQSNLLAVNASIEAAKAGEQGKGFAVVAQEVKSLADQSKLATTQVRTILSDIQKATGAAVMATEQGGKAVEVGVQQSAQAGDSIVTLADSVGEASQAATQIATSSQQQLVGMDQVVTAMESVKQASQQNVDGAKQLETAARNLNALGQRLRQQVGQYKV